MQVYSINKNDKTSFNGLTKSLKNRIYVDGQKDIEKILLQKNKTNPVVGQLPAYIFNKISPEKRKTAILEILKTFDNVTNILRDYTPDMTEAFIFDEDRRNCPNYVNKMLTECFQKYNVISKFDDIELRWLGKGGRGKAYKIVGLYDRDNEDEYVLKVFHQVKGNEWHPFKSHGCFAELNSAAYWRNVEGLDTHRGKFFFGSLDSGYMVTKFLDEDTRLPKRIVDEYKYGIKCTDEKKYKTKVSYEQDYNYVKDYNFDYGGMRVVNRLKNGDKVARKRLEKFKKLTNLQQKIFWFNIFFNNGDSRFLSLKKKKSSESDFAGITLGIKYLYDKNYYIDRCLKLEKPKVDQAIAYVLKYLDNYEDQLKYFEILAKRKDEITQTISLNKIVCVISSFLFANILKY